MTRNVTRGTLVFEPHNGFGVDDPDGDPWPFGYISTSPTPQPVFVLDVVLKYDQKELVSLAKRMAASNLLLDACKDAKKFLIDDLDEPGRTVFWKLVAAIQAAGDEA